MIKRITRPGVLLTHTEPLSFGLSFFPRIAVLDIADEQYKLIDSMLQAGRPVRMRLIVHNGFTSGPIDCANLVGEIPGYEHPEQVVIVAAHLDSWDLGTGAIDDGFGAAAVLGVAEQMMRAGVKPRRTIRFVLFTGEEQGLLGSQAYVRRHKDDLANILCVFALDWGQGPITKFAPRGTFRTGGRAATGERGGGQRRLSVRDRCLLLHPCGATGRCRVSGFAQLYGDRAFRGGHLG